ncbi:YncE family protein, partial [Actinoplanes sp. NPDC026623]
MSEEFLPRHVLTEIDSPIRESRLMGVGELAQLVTSSDLVMAAAAHLALRRLADDDSRTVAAAAATVLGRTAVRLNPDRVDFGEVPHGTPHLVADVIVEGPPLAFATATVTASGPGLRAALTGRNLRILWQPRSDWLDGSITINGTAGWAEVRVTGQVAQTEPEFRAGLEAQLQAEAGLGGGNAARVTVLPAPPARRRVGAAVIIAGLTAVGLLGGAGVAMALTNGAQRDLTAAGPATTP